MNPEGSLSYYEQKNLVKDPMARHFGFKMLQLDEAQVVAIYRPLEEHLNMQKRVQGEAFYALAEYSIALSQSLANHIEEKSSQEN